MRIRLVDDNAGVLFATQGLLKHMGQSVTAFSDPLEAIDSLTNYPVDLGISDVGMPTMNGFDLAGEVARICGTAPPKVLLISGYAETESELRKTSPATVIGLLEKPFTRRNLSRVISLVEQSRSRCPGTIAPLCQYMSLDCDDSEKAVGSELCCTPRYAECPHYARWCGRKLRTWIWNG